MNKKNKVTSNNFGNLLLEGSKQALDHARGKIILKTEVLKIVNNLEEMMDVLTIKVERLDNLFHKAASKKGINKPRVVYYNSKDVFINSFTQEKIEVLRVVKNKKPDSISALTTFFDGINEEDMNLLCKQLEVEGYLNIKSSPKGDKVPQLSFDYNVIFIEENNEVIILADSLLKELHRYKMEIDVSRKITLTNDSFDKLMTYLENPPEETKKFLDAVNRFNSLK